MTLRLQSQLFVDNLPDEQTDNAWEVVMPTLRIGETSDELQKSSANWGSFIAAMTGKEYTPIVEEIRFGVRNFGTNARRVRTGWVNVPDGIENIKEVNIKFFCSNAMLTQYYLEAWKQLIFNESGEYYNHMNFYKKNIEVYFYGTGNVGAGIPPSAHYTLVGCFPYSQEQYQLNYSGQPKRLSLKAQFKVDKIKFDQNLMKSSIIEEIVGSPLALADRAISYLSSGPSQYSLDTTYE